MDEIKETNQEQEEQTVRYLKNKSEHKPRISRRLFLFLTAFIIVAFIFIFKNGTVVQVSNNDTLLGRVFNFFATASDIPKKDTIDAAIFGLRGKDDPNGGLLADTIIIFRYQKETKRAALISIPRDLYVEMTGFNRKEKINFAYELGEKQKAGGGLEYAKKIIGNICGLNIDYAISVDFSAFEKIIDQLNGIDVTLAQDFSEPNQWGEINFHLPKGVNHLDGQTALYYVRSRFSSNDFDRARRQQDIILATKEKALTLGILTNPFRVYNLTKILMEHIQSDFGLNEMITLVKIANQINSAEITRKVFDISSGSLYSTYAGKNYILLPKNNDFNLLKNSCRNIFENQSK